MRRGTAHFPRGASNWLTGAQGTHQLRDSFDQPGGVVPSRRASSICEGDGRFTVPLRKVAGAPSGREAIKAYITAYLDGFPDLHIPIDQLLAVGDKVVSVFTFTGTHNGDLFGVTPTGRTISVRQIAIYRLESGQVVDEWEISDQLRLMQQIGAHAG